MLLECNLIEQILESRIMDLGVFYFVISLTRIFSVSVSGYLSAGCQSIRSGASLSLSEINCSAKITCGGKTNYHTKIKYLKLSVALSSSLYDFKFHFLCFND